MNYSIDWDGPGERDADPPENTAFDEWCFTATDDRTLIDGKPIPMMTTLLYRVCDNDRKKFEEAIRLLQAAFEAGEATSSPSSSPTEVTVGST